MANASLGQEMEGVRGLGGKEGGRERQGERNRNRILGVQYRMVASGKAIMKTRGYNVVSWWVLFVPHSLFIQISLHCQH